MTKYPQIKIMPAVVSGCGLCAHYCIAYELAHLDLIKEQHDTNSSLETKALIFRYLNYNISANS